MSSALMKTMKKVQTDVSFIGSLNEIEFYH